MPTAAPSKIESGSWVWSKDYECLVPKAQHLANQHNFYDEIRSDLPSPAVHPSGTGMHGGFKSMADGRHYETRRNYEESVRRAGCEIVGNADPSTYVAKPLSDRAVEADVVADVKAAIQIEQSKVPSYGPAARRLMRKQRRQERATKI